MVPQPRWSCDGFWISFVGRPLARLNDCIFTEQTHFRAHPLTDTMAVQTAEEQAVLRHAERRDSEEFAWDRYTECNPRPDASSDCELNTYLSLGADDEVRNHVLRL